MTRAWGLAVVVVAVLAVTGCSGDGSGKADAGARGLGSDARDAPDEPSPDRPPPDARDSATTCNELPACDESALLFYGGFPSPSCPGRRCVSCTTSANLSQLGCKPADDDRYCQNLPTSVAAHIPGYVNDCN